MSYIGVSYIIIMCICIIAFILNLFIDRILDRVLKSSEENDPALKFEFSEGKV